MSRKLLTLGLVVAAGTVASLALPVLRRRIPGESAEQAAMKYAAHRLEERAQEAGFSLKASVRDEGVDLSKGEMSFSLSITCTLDRRRIGDLAAVYEALVSELQGESTGVGDIWDIIAGSLADDARKLRGRAEATGANNPNLVVDGTKLAQSIDSWRAEGIDRNEIVRRAADSIYALTYRRLAESEEAQSNPLGALEAVQSVHSAAVSMLEVADRLVAAGVPEGRLREATLYRSAVMRDATAGAARQALDRLSALAGESGGPESDLAGSSSQTVGGEKVLSAAGVLREARHLREEAGDPQSIGVVLKNARPSDGIEAPARVIADGFWFQEVISLFNKPSPDDPDDRAEKIEQWHGAAAALLAEEKRDTSVGRFRTAVIGLAVSLAHTRAMGLLKSLRDAQARESGAPLGGPSTGSEPLGGPQT